MAPNILTTAQVAERFAVNASTVGLWANSGRLPHFRTPGGHRRFRADDVERLIAGGAEPAPAVSA